MSKEHNKKDLYGKKGGRAESDGSNEEDIQILPSSQINADV